MIHNGTRPAHSHLIHDSLWTRILAQFLSTQFSSHGMSWPGRRHIHLPSESQHRAGIEPRPPGRQSRLIPTTPLRLNCIYYTYNVRLAIIYCEKLGFVLGTAHKQEKNTLLNSQMPRHLISDAHEWINKISTVPIYYLAKPQPRERAWQNQRGKKTLLSLTRV